MTSILINFPLDIFLNAVTLIFNKIVIYGAVIYVPSRYLHESLKK